MSNPGSLVSVDVITLRYNPELRRVEVATRPRTTEPYLGVPALPGVLLWEGGDRPPRRTAPWSARSASTSPRWTS